MAGYHQGRPSWMDTGFYSVKDRLLKGMAVDEHAATIVDVGGGMGHDLVELKKKQPDLQGRFILQDLPQVVEQIVQPLEGIEVTSHDFYTKQPVIGTLPRSTFLATTQYLCISAGARVYFMHSVLHDWPDVDCRRFSSTPSKQ